MSDPERFARVSELFERARDLERADRDAFLREACAGDEALIAEVARLLQHHDAERGPLAEPVIAAGAAASLLRGAPRKAPETIGRYRVRRELGSGGMGVVYLAEQERPRREVAIKVIRPGVVTDELLRRFDLEASLLGRLQHPGIARIYEAGVFDDGGGTSPFFAMEFVQGSPLLEFAREKGLGLRDRLELFAGLCDAVQHAHQRGVIHRDLKPANVLVDESGQPKILDFGVARATDADLSATTLHTDVGQLVGTLAYMSPEQVAGRAADIDTRSDVYALGVVLFELLCDRLPYDLRDQVVAAAVRVISEEEPTSLTSIDRTYRGDLDTIVQKAMEKAPARRYQTASDFGSDVRRFLNDEPIVARPATTWYQVSKFARRNRGLVSGVAAAFVALVAGVAFSVTFAIGQSRALAESERQRTIAAAVNQFLTEDLIELADPNVEADRDITLSTALDRAVAKIEGRFVGAPLAEANLRLTIGRAYRRLSRLEEAQEQLERALDLFGAAGSPTDEDELLTRMELVAIVSARAEFAKAEAALRAMLAVQRDALGDDHVQTMASLNNLGAALIGQGRFAEAEAVLEEALERRSRVLGARDSDTGTTMNNLASVCLYTGRFDEAADLLARALEVHRENDGDRHPETLRTMANLGIARHRLGRLDEAVAVLEEALPLHREVLGPDHRSTLQVSSSLASLYGRQGEQPKRESLLTETLAVQREVMGERHLDTLITRMNLAKVDYDSGEHEAALAVYRDLVGVYDADYPDHFLGAIVRTMAGRCLMELERFEAAETEFTGAYEKLSGLMGAEHRDAMQIAETLADLYSRWDKPDQAETWRARSASAGSP